MYYDRYLIHGDNVLTHEASRRRKCIFIENSSFQMMIKERSTECITEIELPGLPM